VKVYLETLDHDSLTAAIENLEESVRLEPFEVEYLLMAGRTQELALDGAKAFGHYRVATGLGHDDPLVWRRMGVLALELGDLDQARGCLERALSHEVVDPELFFGYGCLLDLENELDQARNAFEAAIASRRTYDDAYFRLAKVLRGLGDEEGADYAAAKFEEWKAVHQALADARKHAAKNPADGESVRSVGILLLKLDQAEESVEWLRRAKGMLPGDALTLEQLGRAQQTLGQLSAARRSLESAVKIAPNQPSGLQALAFVLGEGGDPDEALERMRQALALAPNDANLLYQQGVLFMQLGQPSDAFEAYSEALLNDPESVDALLGLAEVHYGDGRREDARATYRSVLAIQPGNPAARSSLAFILEEDGE